MIEYIEGTNVPVGTDFIFQLARTSNWYEPRNAVQTPGWRRTLERLQSEFSEHSRRYRPVIGVMTQTLRPQSQEIVEPAEFAHCDLVSLGTGLQRDLTQLFTPCGETLFGDWPVISPKGRSLANSTGDPFAVRLGFTRIHQVLCPRSYRVGDSREVADGGSFEAVATEASSLLQGLPRSIAELIWRNWQEGFKPPSGFMLWLEALHELGGRSGAKVPLAAKRQVWRDPYTSIMLDGSGLYPQLPVSRTELPVPSVASLHGNPYCWSSRIDDLTRASLAAIDWLLSLPHEARDRSPPRLLSDFPPVQLLPISNVAMEALRLLINDKLSPLEAVRKARPKATGVELLLCLAMVQRDALARALADDVNCEESQAERQRCAAIGLRYIGRSGALAEAYERSGETYRAYQLALAAVRDSPAASFLLPKVEQLRSALNRFVASGVERFSAGHFTFRGSVEEKKLGAAMLDVLDHLDAFPFENDVRTKSHPSKGKKLEEEGGQGTGEWPPDVGWHFRPGEASFRGHRFPIKSTPLARLLERLANAQRYLLMNELIEAVIGSDPAAIEPEWKTVRGYLSDLRNLLRTEFEFKKNYDPIPRRKAADGSAWGLSNDLLP